MRYCACDGRTGALGCYLSLTLRQQEFDKSFCSFCAGHYHSCELASEPSDDNTFVTAASGPPSHAISFQQSLDEQSSISTVRSFPRRTASVHDPAPIKTQVDGNPDNPGQEAPATSVMATNTAASTLDAEAVADVEKAALSMHEDVLRDLVAYASIGHEARAHLHQHAAADQLECPHSSVGQPEGCNSVPQNDRKSDLSETAPKHRYPTSLASSTAWPTDEQVLDSEASAPFCMQYLKTSRDDAHGVASLGHTTNDLTEGKACDQLSAGDALPRESRQPAQISEAAAHPLEEVFGSGMRPLGFLNAWQCYDSESSLKRSLCRPLRFKSSRHNGPQS